MTDAPENTERVRAAEIAASLCLATDLGMGFPLEHGLHATLMAVRLAELLGLDAETTNQIYYAAMLMYTGCTVDAVENAQVFAGSRTEHLTPTNFGSMRERLSGIVRAMPPPGSAPLAERSRSPAGYPVPWPMQPSISRPCARWPRCFAADSGSPLRSTASSLS